MNAKRILSKVSNLLKYRSIPYLRNKVQKLEKYVYFNIGVEKNGFGAPRVLFLFPTNSLGYYIQGRLDEGLSSSMHNIYFQGLAIVDCLVRAGYIVDCVQKDAFDLKADTSGYRIIMDEGNSLGFLPTYKGQTKVFYCTGLRWARLNRSELERIHWFYEAYGVYVKPQRQIEANFSHKAADYILYKGVLEQMADFNSQAVRYQLAMPVDYVPKRLEREFSQREFVWIGGFGAVHKGLDIVVDAFEQMPDIKLHIYGRVESESGVNKWFFEKLDKCSNIIYHGYASYKDETFKSVIKRCVGHVYPSAGENGCATLAQTAHFGLIPIATSSSNNQANHLGFEIYGDDRWSMIESVKQAVCQVCLMSDKEVKERAGKIIDFARQQFTREAFIRSFDKFLQEIEHSRCASYKKCQIEPLRK